MIETTLYRWSKSPNGPRRVVLTMAALAILFWTLAVGMAVLDEYLASAGLVVLSFILVTGPRTPSPRIEKSGHGIEVFPRPPLNNSHYVFPVCGFVAAVLFTAQWYADSPGADLRMPFISVAMWVAFLAGLGAAVRQRGNLLLDSECIAVGRNPSVPLAAAELTILQARKNAIPHIQLVDTSGKSKKRLIFPEKYYGLDASSLYSTVRHLAETDEESRRAYSPELIREMLLFKPDRDVPVGETIEVRVVAHPTATSS